MTRERRPVALTIAGSDSGGGAGIQADLKTFAALGVHGASAVTCVTAQNPREVRSIQPIKPAVVRDQIEAVLADFRPQATKTGMLYSAPVILEVARAWEQSPCPLVVDPVMVATSGAILLQPRAIRALFDKLLPQALLVTPNLDEAQILTGRKLRSLDDLRQAAREIHARFGCAALVKGGHLRNQPMASDIFFDGTREKLLESEFVKNVSTHGTGCAYSAAITAHLAVGKPLLQAVAAAKRFISRAIAHSYSAGRHQVLRTL